MNVTLYIEPIDGEPFVHAVETTDLRTVYGACRRVFGEPMGKNISPRGFLFWKFKGGDVMLRGDVKQILGYRGVKR